MASTTVEPPPPVPTTTATTTATTTTGSTTTGSTTVNPNVNHEISTTIRTSNNCNNTFNNNNKKRPLDHLQTSPYFKMRALLKDLRPLFLQVLRAPDIQNCEAGHGIQEKMKLMIDLSKQEVENAPLLKCNNGAGSQDLAGAQKPFLMPRDTKPTDQLHQPQVDRYLVRSGEEKRFPVGNNPEKQTSDGSRIPGTYIVGGSAFGWNFITFHGTKPEYYGRSKEAFRAGK